MMKKIRHISASVDNCVWFYFSLNSSKESLCFMQNDKKSDKKSDNFFQRRNKHTVQNSAESLFHFGKKR